MRYTLAIKGSWKELSAKYRHLTNLDMECGEGKYEEMMEGLQSKLGKTRQELIKILNRL